MASNLVKLISSENKTVEVDVAVAMESEMVKDIIDAKGINEPILLPDVSNNTLVKVMEYCRYHVEKTSPATPEDEIKAWDADFVKVAKDRKIKNLVDLACQSVADRNMTPEELLNNEHDFTTPEEEAEFRREWALSRGKVTVEFMKEVLYK